MTEFDFTILKHDDLLIAKSILGELRDPDLIIAPDGNPYLYRWHLIRNKDASSYFHIQVADDPERPLHDHPWDNFSVILAGGYKEILSYSEGEPSDGTTVTMIRQKGDTIFRKAKWPHRLELLRGEDYAMTLFTTGPKVRDWGFWYPHGWVPYTDVTRQIGNKSVHIKGGM